MAPNLETPERCNTDRELESGCCYDLAIGCVFQNEAPYLKEWIEFHKMVGVRHFVLVDDASSDDYVSILQPYLDSGEVELVQRPCPDGLRGSGWPQYQCAVHAALVDHLRGVARWLGLVDIDEFIVPMSHANVPDFLNEYEDYGGVYIRWEPFGTSHLAKLSPGELMTRQLELKWRFRKGHQMLGKSIVKPHRVLHANIHQCELLGGFPYFDSNPGMQNEMPLIKIHHYWSRDEAFLFTRKLPRTARIKGWEIDRERIEYFRLLFNDVPDRTMARFAPELHSRVFGLPMNTPMRHARTTGQS